jgi:hypothetical protein
MEKFFMVFLIFGVFVVSGCVTSNGPDSLIIDDEAGLTKPISPMNLIFGATILSNGEMELTVIMKRASENIEGFMAPNVTMEISLPEQLQITGGEPGWYGDIAGEQVVERTIRVEPVADGEGVVEASAVTSPIGGSFFGDSERLWVYVTGSKVRISDSPFTPSTTYQQSQRME